MLTKTRVEESLERIRAGMEARSRRIAGRVGEQLAAYVSRPGKMLRSRFALHLGAGLGVELSKAETVARAMEFGHNASLLHDDCVDEAGLRRGLPTPNAVYGPSVALLLGDIAFTQALEEVLDLHPRAVERMVCTTREMAIGELQEEFLRGSADVSLEAYLGIVSRKTGALFEWGAAVLSDLSPLEHAQADPPKLGQAVGIVLQVVDDIHDFTLEGDISGKERAKDAAMGRLTLPGVYAVADPASRAPFLAIWGAAGKEPGAADRLAELVERSGALAKARAKCRAIVRSIQALARRLPVQAEARELSSFLDVMLKREF
ncbi:MAG: polyprenyl synthetase family protein [Elusimicrobia bacterium]|nr:polyprenyl synthetase family protein [Elusimicrobiota bacterium]